MTSRRLITTLAGMLLGAAFVIGVFVLGMHVGADGGGGEGGRDGGARTDVASRDFMFQVLGVNTRNQGGHTLNLYFHYRYNDGISDADIPDYTKLRKQALAYLDGPAIAGDPYWEVLNHGLCAQLKAGYPIRAISCELQVVGTENPAPHDEPGYRASTETIGDIAPLAIPGPATR